MLSILNDFFALLQKPILKATIEPNKKPKAVTLSTTCCDCHRRVHYRVLNSKIHSCHFEEPLISLIYQRWIDPVNFVYSVKNVLKR